MSTLRVTDGSSSDDSAAGPQSGDPSGTVRALQPRLGFRRNSQYVRDALGWLSTRHATYTQIVALAQDARALVAQGLDPHGLDSGAAEAASSAALADRIDAIRTSLIDLANTTYNGRPVFGGTAPGTAAYDAAGTFVGDSGGEVFGLLANIAATLRSEPAALGTDATALGTDATALGTDATALDAAISTIRTAQATERAAYQHVQKAGAALAPTVQLADIQEIDLADLAREVATASINYQAALQTTASIRQLSLREFLR